MLHETEVKDFESWYRENYRASDTKEMAAKRAWDYQTEELDVMGGAER